MRLPLERGGETEGDAGVLGFIFLHLKDVVDEGVPDHGPAERLHPRPDLLRKIAVELFKAVFVQQDLNVQVAVLELMALLADAVLELDHAAVVLHVRAGAEQGDLKLAAVLDGLAADGDIIIEEGQYEREHRAEDRLNVILKKAAPGHKQRECDEEDCRHEEDPVEVAVLDAPADLDPEAEEEHREEEKKSPEKQDRSDVQNRIENMVDRVLR